MLAWQTIYLRKQLNENQRLPAVLIHSIPPLHSFCVIHTKEKKNSMTWTGRLKSTCCMHACMLGFIMLPFKIINYKQLLVELWCVPVMCARTTVQCLIACSLIIHHLRAHTPSLTILGSLCISVSASTYKNPVLKINRHPYRIYSKVHID